MAVRIQMRRGTTSQWNTADPILNEGEIGYNTTLGQIKIGDGSTVWSSLDYMVTDAELTTSLGNYIELTEKGAVSGVAELDENKNVLTRESVIFEGATTNSYQTTLVTVDPTADRTITLPDSTGTVVVADVSGNVLISGNLTVSGTTTTIDTQNLLVEDKNITIGDVATPTDVTADGGGITLKGTTDKTFNWVDATDSWTSSENINLASGKTYFKNGTDIKDVTETLTNKTISGTSNTITNVANTSLTNSSITINGTAVSLGGSINIAGDIESVSAGTGLTGGGTSGAVTLSVDTAVVATTNNTLTMSNKTLTSPVISGLSLSDSSIVFEGSTANEFETTLTVTDPTADRTITIPNVTGTVITTGDTGTVTNTMLSGSIANDKLSNSAITINGTAVSLGGSISLPGDIESVSAGTGLTGGGTSGAVTLSVDTTVVATTNNTLTLSNKTIALGSNTVSGTTAQFNTALTDGDFATLAGTETLTNKTLTDSTTTFQDNTDNTKKMQFELSGITTATTRTLTVPNVNGTIVTTGDTGTVTSTMIADGTIVNADINTSAAIALSKLASGTSGQIIVANASGVPTWVSESGDVTISDTGVTAIASGVIVDADISASAAIDKTKISGTAVTLSDTGTVTSTMIADGTIVNADINASAAIAVSKLASSTISGVTLGNNLNALTIGTGLSGTSYNGSSAVTVAIDSTVATTSGAQTLTNKTIALGNNTISGTTAQFNTALTDGDFATVAGTETLTNKTLTAPRFADLGFIADANGNELIIMDTVASAVNEITVANATTSGTPTITASGGDTNISLNLVAKGSGTVQAGGVPVVTTTGTQTLTNKTLTTPVISSISNTGTLTLPTSTDTLVGRATTDTLTNKTIALGNNTVSGTTAQFNTALTDGDFATLAGSETLTNKTLGSTTALGANLNAATFKITSLGTPTASTDAATKQYVDDLAQGLHIHASVVAATTANLTATYSNGSSGVGATLTNSGTQAALVIDGVTLSTSDRVLVKNQTTQLQNGIYTVTNTGSVSTNWVLTRATDMDESVEVDGGDFVFVTGGTVGDNTGWVQTSTGVTVGTTAIIFTQFSGAGTYLAGNGLTLTGNTFSIDTAITANLSGSQTLTNKTIALGSNTISGTIAQFNTALSDADFATLAGTETLTNKTVNLSSNTLTGTVAQFNTALSDGDFATLAGSETFTNKTLTSPVITGLTLNDSSIIFEGSSADQHETTLTVTNPTADRTITLPDATGTIALQGFIPASLTWGDLKNGKSA